MESYDVLPKRYKVQVFFHEFEEYDIVLGQLQSSDETKFEFEQ